MRRLDYQYYLRLHSISSTIHTAEGMAYCIAQALSAQNLEIRGFIDENERLSPLPIGGLKDLFLLDNTRLMTFVLSDKPYLALNVMWFGPDDPVLMVNPNPRFRLDLGFAVGRGLGWDVAEGILLSCVEHINPHWAEINDVAVVGSPTLCTLGGHIHCIPHLGSANYFGREYVEFFGGRCPIEAAGFAKAVPYHEGMYVMLPLVASKEEYLAVRQTVEPRLATEDLFDPQHTGGPVPRFWAPPGPDN